MIKIRLIRIPSIRTKRLSNKFGLDIADLVTYWKLQKNPSKAYISNRRLHYVEIGSLLSLSNLHKKSQPTRHESCLVGEGLIKDGYADKDEWTHTSE